MGVKALKQIVTAIEARLWIPILSCCHCSLTRRQVLSEIHQQIKSQMFFNFGRFFMQQSQLDTLTTQPDCTLERILDADNILPELKGMGANKFADFVTKNPDHYETMINYVIDYNENQIDRKTQIQYPFLVSEVLSTENQKLIDFLFESGGEFDEPEDQEKEKKRQGLLPQLLSFLDQDTLCVTSAGYFSKVMLPIIRKRGYDMWNYIKSNPSLLANLVKHLDIRHIAEIVEKLIILETQQETPYSFLAERQLFLERIIAYMNQKQHVIEIVENISDILCEITSKSMSNIFYNNNEIIPFIEQIKQPELLFTIALRTQCPGTYQILINLVEMMSKEQTKQDDDEVVHNDAQDKDYSQFYNIISELPAALQQQDYYIHDFESSNKQTVQPFGLAKMKVLKLILVLLQSNDQEIQTKFSNTELFVILQRITVQNPTNNQIHNFFDKIVRIIFESQKSDFIDRLLVDSQLLTFIAKYNTKENKKKEYIGFLTRLSNYLIEKAQNNDSLIQLMARSNYYVKQDQPWQAYIKDVLKDINEKEQKFLCGVNPKQKDPVEDEDDINIDNGVLEILKVSFSINQKFNPQTRNHDDQKEEGQAEIIQEEIRIQEEDDLSPPFDGLEVEKQQEHEEYIVNRFWKTPINNDFAEHVLNNYE